MQKQQISLNTSIWKKAAEYIAEGMFCAFDKIINPKYYKEYVYALAHEVSFDANEYTFESFFLLPC